MIERLDGGKTERAGVTGRSLHGGVDHPVNFSVTIFPLTLSWGEKKSQEKNLKYL